MDGLGRQAGDAAADGPGAPRRHCAARDVLSRGGAASVGADQGCGDLFDRAIEAEKIRAAEDKEEHDEDAQEKDDKDGSGDDSGDGSDDEEPMRYCSWGEYTRGEADDCLTRDEDGDGDEADEGDSVCDSDTAPTNPSSLPGGPSPSTPEQWAAYQAWFRCS